MSEGEQPGRSIDELGVLEFMNEFWKFFGHLRGVQLFGWAMLWGVQGIENGPEFREKLKKEGFSRSAAYRASLDFRRFRMYIEQRVGHPVTNEELYEELRHAEEQIRTRPKVGTGDKTVV